MGDVEYEKPEGIDEDKQREIENEFEIKRLREKVHQLRGIAMAYRESWLVGLAAMLNDQQFQNILKEE